MNEMPEITAMDAQWQHIQKVFDEIFAPIANAQAARIAPAVEEEQEPTEEQLQTAYNDLYAEAIDDKHIMGDIVTYCPKHDWQQIAEAFRTLDYYHLGMVFHARMTVAAKEHAEENKMDLAKDRLKANG